MGLEAASMLDSGRIPSVEVSVEKIFTSELRQRIADLALDLLGPEGLRAHRAPAHRSTDSSSGSTGCRRSCGSAVAPTKSFVT